MKSKNILLTSAILAVLLVGCNMKAPTQTPKKTPKVITATSMVSTPKEFEKAISSNGTWIITLKKNITINKDLVVNGEFKKDKNIVGRNIDLYSQDKNKNITNKFILTVPKLTVNSPKTSIEHGTFKGDLYVASNNFQLIDTTVKGNLYFTTNEAKNTCKMDAKSKVTGKQELVTTLNEVDTAASFEKAISKDGIQTIDMKKSLTINKNLVVDGEFRSDKALLQRKINLYSQDKAKNIGDRFTLAVPKLTIKSTETSMEHGTFKGDLYISANNFQLIDTKVEGNVYFTTPEAKNTCKMDAKSKVIGKQELRK
ncbi:hypothetical protein LL033_15030 [Clostridium estertheticum]|uniref:hypothetical protein n=1 Tax=Clostridium estertheticum TaxID=238834 RepID=UPI001C0E740E|nr:hypothetical protein [Clostridium estertheticum]MBU3216853.1 hypothetical protein [Clostridium estertheticum]WAG53959.1 hypothetical protein LL033_15030 [Clostridium estertheticum]